MNKIDSIQFVFTVRQTNMSSMVEYVQNYNNNNDLRKMGNIMLDMLTNYTNRNRRRYYA